jgi:hypothetical protein
MDFLVDTAVSNSSTNPVIQVLTIFICFASILHPSDSEGTYTQKFPFAGNGYYYASLVWSLGYGRVCQVQVLASNISSFYFLDAPGAILVINPFDGVANFPF